MIIDKKTIIPDGTIDLTGFDCYAVDPIEELTVKGTSGNWYEPASGPESCVAFTAVFLEGFDTLCDPLDLLEAGCQVMLRLNLESEYCNSDTFDLLLDIQTVEYISDESNPHIILHLKKPEYVELSGMAPPQSYSGRI